MILAFENIPSTISKKEFRLALKNKEGVRGIMKHNNRFYVRVPNDKLAINLMEQYHQEDLFGQKITVKPSRSATNLSFCRTSLGMIRMF
jgi:hypothetical protein